MEVESLGERPSGGVDAGECVIIEGTGEYGWYQWLLVWGSSSAGHTTLELLPDA